MAKSSINSLIAQGFRFISDNTNIIKGIYKHVSYNDEPKLYGYSVSFTDSSNPKGEADAGGLSFNQNTAILRALGETIERFSMSINDETKFKLASFRNLTKLYIAALDPHDLCSFSDTRKPTDNLRTIPLQWIEGKSLSTNEKIFIPAQLIYVPFIYQNSEPELSVPISTGAAAGSGLADALYRGICEVVERDSFMIAYLNKISSPHINLSSVDNGLFLNTLEAFRRYNLELIVLNLTTKLQIPSFAAIILDRTGIGPSVSVGLKAGFNSSNAIMGAIEEAQMVRFYSRDLASNNIGVKDNHEIQTIEDRARLWYPTSMIKHLDFWLKRKTYKMLNSPKVGSSERNLQKAVSLLKQNGVDVLYVDITDRLVKKYGFTVVKVVIPQLQPLYLDERNPYFQHNRLVKNNDLNKIPHPFL